MKENYVSLETLGGGPGHGSSAAIELFNAEFQRVLDNCLDENTKPNAVRELRSVRGRRRRMEAHGHQSNQRVPESCFAECDDSGVRVAAE